MGMHGVSGLMVHWNHGSLLFSPLSLLAESCKDAELALFCRHQMLSSVTACFTIFLSTPLPETYNNNKNLPATYGITLIWN